jgi:hypothetical protein
MIKTEFRKTTQTPFLFRITLIFIIGYVLVNRIYAFFFTKEMLEPLLIFLTSPFNELENFSKVYSLFMEGLCT